MGINNFRKHCLLFSEKSQSLLFYLRKYSITVKLIFSFTVLLLFLTSIDINKVFNVLASITGLDIFILVLIIVARNIIAAVRFQCLLRGRVFVSFMELIRQYFIASLFNTILPTALGGDGIRVLMLAKYDLSKIDAGMLIITERLIGFYSLVVIAFIASFFSQLPQVVVAISKVLFVGYTLVLALIFFYPCKHKEENIRKEFFNKVKNMFLDLRSKPEIFISVFTYSLVYQLLSILISFFIAWSVGLSPNIIHFLVIVPTVWFCTMLPISFGGLGVREVSFVYFLSFVGYTSEESAIVSLGTYFTLILSAAIGAVIMFYFNANLVNEVMSE